MRLPREVTADAYLVWAIARDMLKFESRYLDWLIGPYSQDQKTCAGVPISQRQ
jgi:hypothetical protein